MSGTSTKSDAAIFSVDDPNNMDEIKSFQLGRYVSSHEVSNIVCSSKSLNFDLKGNEKIFKIDSLHHS